MLFTGEKRQVARNANPKLAENQLAETIPRSEELLYRHEFGKSWTTMQ